MDELCFICGLEVESTDDRVYDRHGLGPYCDACWDDFVLSHAPEDGSSDVEAAVVACTTCGSLGVVCSACGCGTLSCECVDLTLGKPVQCVTCQGFGSLAVIDVEECDACMGTGEVCARCDVPILYCAGDNHDAYPVRCEICAGYGLLEAGTNEAMSLESELDSDSDEVWARAEARNVERFRRADRESLR